MQMSDRHYYDSISVHTVDQTIGEASQQAASQAGLYFQTGKRVGEGSSNSPIQFIKKLYAQTGSLLIVPGYRVVEFGLRRFKKANLHDRRCLAMTSSYDTVGMRPAL